MSEACQCSEWAEVAKVLLWLTADDDQNLRVRPFMLDAQGEPIYVLYCPSCGGDAPQQATAESLEEAESEGIEDALADLVG